MYLKQIKPIDDLVNLVVAAVLAHLLENPRREEAEIVLSQKRRGILNQSEIISYFSIIIYCDRGRNRSRTRSPSDHRQKRGGGGGGRDNRGKNFRFDSPPKEVKMQQEMEKQEKNSLELLSHIMPNFENRTNFRICSKTNTWAVFDRD